jgi:hypothetical protein
MYGLVNESLTTERKAYYIDTNGKLNRGICVALKSRNRALTRRVVRTFLAVMFFFVP